MPSTQLRDRSVSRGILCAISAAVIVTATVVSAIVSTGTEVAMAVGATYYVDCASGKDNNSGKSQASAWRTIDRANDAGLNPGDSLLFKRGCRWNGPLFASWNGTSGSRILIGAYGSGDRPMIRNAPNANVKITGSYLVIENLQTRTDTDQYALDGSCQNQPVGWKIGFQFDGPAHHNTVRYSRTSNHAMGFGFSDNSHHNVVTGNDIRDNVALWSNQPGYPQGGTGINLHGNANQVTWNTFSGNKVRCGTAGDGSISTLLSSISIELFHATKSKVSHNVSYDRIFVELGSSSQVTSADNTFAYNVHSNSEERTRFVVTRGSGAPHGPVLRTRLYNNVVYNNGADSQGVVCINCSPNVLTMKNTIIAVGTKALTVSDGNAFNESNNIYWPLSGLPMPNNFIQNWNIDATSMVTNPQFVNPASRNFHIAAYSPAVDRGSGEPAGSGFTVDLDGDPVPSAGAADIGVDERPGGGAATNEPPQVTAPVHSITDFQLNPDGVPMPVSWTGSDSDGISLYELQFSMNGSPFQTIMTIKSGGQNQSVALNLAPWSTYQLRVRATDNLGAVGDWATGPAFTISLYEESSASIGFSGGWPTAALSGAYGGSVRHADTKGSNATFTFTGQSVTLVSTRGPSRGKAEIWLDGVKKQTVDLYVSGNQTPRRVVFTASGLNPNASHTLEIKVLGAKHQNSSSQRFDVDAIVVVR